MASLQELLAQKEALDREIELTKKQERGDAVKKVRALMSQYGLTVGGSGGTQRAEAQGRLGEESRCEIPRQLHR